MNIEECKKMEIVSFDRNDFFVSSPTLKETYLIDVDNLKLKRLYAGEYMSAERLGRIGDAIHAKLCDRFGEDADPFVIYAGSHLADNPKIEQEKPVRTVEHILSQAHEEILQTHKIDLNSVKFNNHPCLAGVEIEIEGNPVK